MADGTRHDDPGIPDAETDGGAGAGAEGAGRRERRTVERRFGTVYEAGRDAEFVSSPNRTVHRRSPPAADAGRAGGGGGGTGGTSESGGADGPYALTPVCGTSLGPDAVWAGIDADTPEAVATEYHFVSFCTRCFDGSLRLAELGREARH